MATALQIGFVAALILYLDVSVSNVLIAIGCIVAAYFVVWKTSTNAIEIWAEEQEPPLSIQSVERLHSLQTMNPFIWIFSSHWRGKFQDDSGDIREITFRFVMLGQISKVFNEYGSEVA